jgi:TRAP-type C4-dicarboxylate transport system permease small subunit
VIEGYTKGVETLSRLCGILAAGMLLVAMAVLCQMLLVRYLLHAASYWQTELVSYALVGATFLGAPYALTVGGHLNVDFLPRRLSPRFRLPVALAVNLLAGLFCLTITALAAAAWYDAWAGERRSETLWAVPLWIPYLAMPAGFAVLSLQYIANVLGLSAGRPAPFGLPPGQTER